MVVVFCLVAECVIFLFHWFYLRTIYHFSAPIEPISFFSCLWSSNVSLWLKVLLNYFCMFNCIFYSSYISIFEEQFVFLCTILKWEKHYDTFLSKEGTALMICFFMPCQWPSVVVSIIPDLVYDLWYILVRDKSL